MRWDFRAMSAQMARWSARARPEALSEALTSWDFCARLLLYSTWSDDPKSGRRYAQRPRSTQDTGIGVTDRAGTRMEMFTIRFCFAPTSASPSTIRIDRSERFSNLSSGTEPDVDVSVTLATPLASASSSSRYGGGPSLDPRKGKTVRRPTFCG